MYMFTLAIDIQEEKCYCTSHKIESINPVYISIYKATTVCLVFRSKSSPLNNAINSFWHTDDRTIDCLNVATITAP